MERFNQSLTKCARRRVIARILLACLMIALFAPSCGTLSPSPPPPPPGRGGGAGGGGGAATAEAPKFPWPPPPPSSRVEIPAKFFPAARDLGGVNAKLKIALTKAGYVDGGSYYSIPHGFAIATQIEHIDRDGKPMPGEERWRRKPLPPDLTLTNLLKVLFDAKPGFYRIIVFVVTDTKIEPQGEPLTQNAADALLHKGWFSLPPEIAKIPYTKNSICAALIYEFERRGYNDATRSVSFGAPAKTQLVQANIWSALEH